MEKNAEVLRIAEEKIESKILIYKHLALFIAINILLCLINLITSCRISWALWPILGWGIILLAHLYYVIFHTQNLKESMLKKELEKEEKKKASK